MQQVIELFLTDSEKISDDLLNRLLSRLPDAQKAKALKFETHKRRREFIVGRTLLLQALVTYNAFSALPDILEKPSSAPELKGVNDWYLSISHSHQLVCCVLHNSPIGVDIEFKKDITNPIEKSHFFMTAEEVAELELLVSDEAKKHYFYQVWCTKEAIFKALSPAEQNTTSLHTLPYSGVVDGEKRWSIFDTDIENYHLSLAYMGKVERVQLRQIDLLSLI
ncbi:4'-phosphopantetheinyl transferase family protein [Marinomonas transparens]|uniref:4'-phosphopantetheinyl transferase superfamily protein n=1 Tax=Marinomonas transparens TaxID=2795388 RepID=A0A934JXD5_9GAMM|nr:4'-phosphopantetheinyl transferase superfamily protein [Marinomonas transparens]MBJ7538707.1 4'-phosphopantetheinyl transferase superfamily protein [Marinomonas transparens]